jgi:hypothetical protein
VSVLTPAASDGPAADAESVVAGPADRPADVVGQTRPGLDVAQGRNSRASGKARPTRDLLAGRARLALRNDMMLAGRAVNCSS